MSRGQSPKTQEPAGLISAQLSVRVSGDKGKVNQLARDLTQLCDRSGLRYTVERRQPDEEEASLYDGEHRL